MPNQKKNGFLKYFKLYLFLSLSSLLKEQCRQESLVKTAKLYYYKTKHRVTLGLLPGIIISITNSISEKCMKSQLLPLTLGALCSEKGPLIVNVGSYREKYNHILQTEMRTQERIRTATNKPVTCLLFPPPRVELLAYSW